MSGQVKRGCQAVDEELCKLLGNAGQCEAKGGSSVLFTNRRKGKRSLPRSYTFRYGLERSIIPLLNFTIHEMFLSEEHICSQTRGQAIISIASHRPANSLSQRNSAFPPNISVTTDPQTGEPPPLGPPYVTDEAAENTGRGRTIRPVAEAAWTAG